MSQLGIAPRIEMRVTLILSEDEAAALADITGYSTKDLLDALRKVSPMTVNKNQDGLTTFFDSVRRDVPQFIRRIREAREVFQKPYDNAMPPMPADKKPTEVPLEPFWRWWLCETWNRIRGRNT